MSTPTAAHGALPEAGEREAVARAIWAIRREREDRCDMELEDMGKDHDVWLDADAAIAALSPASPAPAVPSEPVAWQVRRYSADPDDLGWCEWRQVPQADLERFKGVAIRKPAMYEVRPLYAATPAQQTQSDAVAGVGFDECAASGLSCTYRQGQGPNGETQCQYCGATPPQQATPSAAASIKPDVLRSVVRELDRLSLVIESAVRNQDPRNHSAIRALIDSARAALKEAPGAAS